MDLTASEEKRRELRQHCTAAIRWSFFNRSASYPGCILNCSSEGLYIETDEKIKPGVTVWIRVEKRFSKPADPAASWCLPNSVVAVGRWCRTLPETTGGHYGVGLRYEIPML